MVRPRLVPGSLLLARFCVTARAAARQTNEARNKRPPPNRILRLLMLSTRPLGAVLAAAVAPVASVEDSLPESPDRETVGG